MVVLGAKNNQAMQIKRPTEVLLTYFNSVTLNVFGRRVSWRFLRRKNVSFLKVSFSCRSPPNRGYGNGAGGGFGTFGGGRGGGRGRQSIERARSVRSESPTLPPEERDQRTIFIMQLAQTINAKDLEKFFSSVGKVRDVRLIVDSKTRRSKGIAYIEFRELEAVPLALGLHGQKLKGCPMNIQPTHAEKNRAAMAAAGAVQKGPMRLYVGSLHFNITEDMLKDIFEPFGKVG